MKNNNNDNNNNKNKNKNIVEKSSKTCGLASSTDNTGYSSTTHTGVDKVVVGWVGGVGGEELGDANTRHHGFSHSIDNPWKGVQRNNENGEEGNAGEYLVMVVMVWCGDGGGDDGGGGGGGGVVV